MGDFLHPDTGEFHDDVEIPEHCSVIRHYIAGDNDHPATLVETAITHLGDGPGKRQLLDHWKHPDHDALVNEARNPSPVENKILENKETKQTFPDWFEVHPELLSKVKDNQ